MEFRLTDADPAAPHVMVVGLDNTSWAGGPTRVHG